MSTAKKSISRTGNNRWGVELEPMILAELGNLRSDLPHAEKQMSELSLFHVKQIAEQSELI